MIRGNIVVAPCFEDNNDPTGLDWNTQFRLKAAAILYFADPSIVKITVGGDRLRKMKRSFADLMEDFLINKMDIPQTAIAKEEHTFDTGSQVWAIKHICKLNGGFILTDKAQAKHIKALLRGNKMYTWGIITMEEVIIDGRHNVLAALLKQRQSTWDWKKFQMREAFVWFCTLADRRGKVLGWIARLTR